MATTSPRAVRKHFIRAALALIVVAAAIVAGRSWGQLTQETVMGGAADLVEPHEAAIGIAALLVILVAGVVAIRSLSAGVRAMMEENAGDKHVAPLGVVITFVGYIGIVICLLVVMKRPVGGILLGGALTGVLIGIAAQQVLANFFAGIVLLMARPFSIADDIVLKSGPLGGEYEGLVTDMGLFYVKLQTHTGPVALPNSGVLAAAIGPGVRAAEERDEEEARRQETDL